MNYRKKLTAACLIVSIIILSCTKHEAYSPAGGSLPTHYVTILPNGILQPTALTIASGASITFVNTHNKPHRILSIDADSSLSIDADSSIYTTIIPPDSSYFFKNDGLIGVFPYTCVLDSSIRGSIIIRVTMQHVEILDKEHFDKNYHRTKPARAVAHFIDYYWQTKFDHLWELHPEGFSDALFPNIGYTYLINLGTAFTMQVGKKKFDMHASR